MEQIHLTYTQAILIGALIGIVIGLLLGLIPLVLGIRKKKTRLGVYGLIASIVGGALSSILSLIIVGVFIWLILKKPEAGVNSSSAGNDFNAENSNSDSSGSDNS